jgi:hypothetical protein
LGTSTRDIASKLCYENPEQVEQENMNRIAQPKKSDFTGSRVLILTGRHEGCEGVCIGKSAGAEGQLSTVDTVLLAEHLVTLFVIHLSSV